ncbi:MAG: Aminotransferase class-III [Verrucomicrobiales bacterium]|nr:Aminotransferase class-III [Verrucomicrobiales bacterium]
MTKIQKVLSLLRDYESRNVTFIDPEGGWPIVWERARGVHIWDLEGKKYLDLTAAFGVAAAGHANPRVVTAGRAQMGKLLHAMGDVHPHRLKAELARKLSEITFERWGNSPGKSIFTNSGFEAVEAALKTALLATGRREVIAFEGAYHGLGYGALNITHRKHFRESFLPQLNEFGHFCKFPSTGSDLPAVERTLRKLGRTRKVGAILVEPIQARGGINVPPTEFLPLLRKIADEIGALLITDEIYTGFGRTGRWFASEHVDVAPDLVCLGKALSGGFPISACVGNAKLMDQAWPRSTGEAIHTSTFLGHPVGCAMALANIAEIASKKLVEKSAALGQFLFDELTSSIRSDSIVARVRSKGLMGGVELSKLNGEPATSISLKVIKNLLKQGFIFLPEGPEANVIGFTPPLTITRAQIHSSVQALATELEAL